MSGVTLITCTGARNVAMALCERFVYRNLKHLGEPAQWIVVDDGGGCGDTATAYARCVPNVTVTRIYPEPAWKPGQNTLARNISVAIPEVRYDKVLFIEDDDWYHSDYVELMSSLLENSDLVGQTMARYYHVPSRQYRLLSNTHHASLCQTGLRSSMLALLQEICKAPTSEFIDVRLWESARNNNKTLFTPIDVWSVGMKGLPGRPGIGIGHRPELGSDWVTDSNLKTLSSWVGADVDLYKQLI